MSKQTKTAGNIAGPIETLITDYSVLRGFDNRIESLTVNQLTEISFDIESDYQFAFEVLADEPEVLLALQALNLIFTLIDFKCCTLFDDSLLDDLPF